MPNNYLPTSDPDFYNWAVNFAAVAQTNKETLGFSAEEISILQSAAADFTQSIGNSIALKAAYESALTNKATRRESLKNLVRPLVNRLQANGNVPANLKTSLGVTVRSGVINHTPPISPARVVAVPLAAGGNTLKWDKNGNKPTTQYVIEAKPFATGAWSMVGQTTRRTFAHTNVVPGEAMLYRVVASRGNRHSEPSQAVSVYAG